MGSPPKPTLQQIDTMEKAGKLKCITTKKLKITNGTAEVPLQLKRQAVALVKLDW